MAGNKLRQALAGIGQKELAYLHDTDFLKAKLNIQDSLRHLLEQCQQNIHQQKTSFGLPEFAWQVPPKISRGENYEGLPYLVLDYPRIFQHDNTFAYRCMFWWGHGFSCTLHLGGQSWREYQSAVLENLTRMPKQNCWICINNSPWEYHYRPDNYLPVPEVTLQDLTRKPFFKISRRFSLDDYENFPDYCIESLRLYSQLLH